MASVLEELLNSMQDMVQEAWAVPLSQEKCVIDRERMLDLLEEMRVSMPADIKMAADIVEKRNDMVAAGKREAEILRQQAEEVARRMVNESEVMIAARKKAKEILGTAEIQARELRRAANEYCEDALKRTEEGVAMSLEEVKKARTRFRGAPKA